MDIQGRAAAAKAVLEDISKAEVALLLKPGTDPVARASGLDRIRKSREGLQDILDGLPTGAESSLSAVEAAHAALTLDYVEAVIARSPSADMRVAQFTGFKKLATDHAQQMDSASKSASDAATLAHVIGMASAQFRKVARDPTIMVSVLQFWNRLVRPDPGLSKFRLLDEYAGITFEDLMTSDLSVQKVFAKALDNAKAPQQLDAIMKNLQVTAQDLKTMATWLGAAVVLLSVTTMVLNAVADEKHWATTLAKGVVSTVAPMLLSQAITTTTVGWALQVFLSPFPAAIATIEVPPVAVVLVCVGLVALVSFAIEELFSWLLETWFGGDIPPSMRAQMMRPMEMSMRKAMAAPMALSMV